MSSRNKHSKYGLLPNEWELININGNSELVTDYVANGSFASLKNGVKYLRTPSDSVLIRLVDYNNGFSGPYVYVDNDSYDFLKKTKLFGNEIIISNVGANVGTVFKCPKLKLKMSLGPNAILVKMRGNNDFFYYWFKSEFGQFALKSIVTGSAQPKFNKTDFRKILIPVPPLVEQKSIAAILSSLDDKIELNNKINKNLEEMAQAIFKSWFVDFEPFKDGEFVESELGLIPKGWGVIKLGDISRFIKGKKPVEIFDKFDLPSQMEYITIDVLNEGTPQYASAEKLVISRPLDILIVMDGASSGTIYFGKEGIVGSTLSKLEVEEKLVEVIYQFLKFSQEEIKSHNTGSAIPHTDKNFALKMQLAIPDSQTLNDISKLFMQIREKIILNKKMNSNIVTIRNSILPKLMSGEIRVRHEEV